MSRDIPKVLDDDEQAAILDVPNTRYDSNKKNLAVLQVLLNTGLRVSEVCDLKREHLDMNAGRIDVRDGKGGSDRTVWFNGDTTDALADWLEVRPGSEYVFPTRKGTRTHENHVRRMVKRCAEKAGISWHEDVSPHTLRHTFATNLLRENGNIRLVQKALGHADVSTTMIYTHIVDDELEAAMKGVA